MNKSEKALGRIKYALQSIDEDLKSDSKLLKAGITDSRINAVKTELKELQHRIESNTIPPKHLRISGIGRSIVDSWPYDLELGGIILKAVQAYLEI